MKSKGLINGRYRLVRTVHQGAEGSVHLVEDQAKAGQQLALKCIPKPNDVRLQALQNEFLLLSRLQHPYLAPVFDFEPLTSHAEVLGIAETKNKTYFFTMPFIEGADLFTATRESSPEDILQLFLKLCFAVDYLHRSGLLHRDLKPGNILIEKSSGHLYVVDLGLGAAHHSQFAGELSGTLEYLPPETLQGAELDQRSDLYALGLTCYKIITGKSPVDGLSPEEILKAHGNGLVLNFSAEIRSRYPAEVLSALEQCVQREPWKRPPSLFNLISALQDALKARALPAPVAPPLGHTPLIGCDEIVEELTAISPPYPKTFLITGPDGGGKTRLLHEIKHLIQIRGERCLETTSGSLSSPNFLRSWASQLGLQSQPAAEVQNDSWYGIATALVNHLQTTAKKTVFLIDDLDRADAEARTILETFFKMLQQAQLPARPIAAEFIAAWTASSVDDLPAPKSTWTWKRIDLELFSEAQGLAYLQALLGQHELPEGLAEYLFALGGGNPLLIRSELDHLLLQEELVWQNGTFRWLQPRSAQASCSETLANVLLKPLAHAPGFVREAMSYAAIFPGTFSAADLTAVLPKNIDLDAFLHWMLLHHLIERCGDGFRFAHEGLRQTLYTQSNAAFRRQAHQDWATATADRERTAIAALLEFAFHLREAGQKDHALATYTQAATLADREQNLALCLQAYAAAAALAQEGNEKNALQIALTRQLIAASRYDEALRRLQEIAPATLAQVELLEWQAMRVQILSRQGRYAEALESAHAFYDQFKEKINDASRAAYARFLGQMGSCCARHGDFVEADKILKEGLIMARKAIDRFTEITLECHQGELALQQNFLKPAKQIYRRTLKRLSQSKRLGTALRGQRLMASIHNNLGKIAALEGKDAEAITHYEESLKISKALGAPAEEAITWIHLGNLHYRRNDFEQTEKAYQKSLNLCRLLHKLREEAMNLFNLGNVYYMTGRLQKALDHHQQALAIVAAMGDPAGIAQSHLALAIVALEIGDLPGAEREIRQAEMQMTEQKTSFSFTYAHLLRGVLNRLQGDLIEARDHFRIAETQFKTLGLVHELSQTYVEWAELELLDKSQTQATTFVQEALRLAEESRASDLQVQAHLILASLHPDTGSRHLGQAENIADKIGLKNLLWRVHVARAALGDTSKNLRTARRLMEETTLGLSDEYLEKFWADPRHRLGSPTAERRMIPEKTLYEMTVRFRNEALSRGFDHLEDLFRINEILNAQTDLPTLLEFILDTAIGLIRAQRGLVLLMQPENPEQPFHVACARNLDHRGLDAPESAFSTSIALSAVEKNEPILIPDALSDSRFSKEGSIHHLKLRSVLCVPLRHRAKILGAIYLDNTRRRDAFGADDIKLMQVVAHQAALALENARLRHELEEKLEMQSFELKEARKQLKSRYDYSNIIGGTSKAMRDVFQLLDKVTATRMPVLIEGESGTGKELIARAIHYNSPQTQSGQFVTENCAAIPPLLLESILFGHVKGAFTGAHQNRKGLFEIASGGTLFLDEVGDMSPAMQAKLLRALQEGEIRPVGANHIIKTNVRIVAASNQRLFQMVEKGQFRKDLFYRLRGMDIYLPALRERPEDLPILIKHFFKEFSAGNVRLSRAAAKLFYQYSWPGNVREMRNLIERLCITLQSGEVQPDDLPPEFRQAAKPQMPQGTLPFLVAKKKFEEQYLTDLMQIYQGNVTRAAAATGLYRQYLHRLLKKYKIEG